MYIVVFNVLRVDGVHSRHISMLAVKVSEDLTGDFTVEKALRIYGTKKQVPEHNQIVIEQF